MITDKVGNRIKELRKIEGISQENWHLRQSWIGHMLRELKVAKEIFL